MLEVEILHDCANCINLVKAEMPNEDILYDMAEMFKICSDASRIKILFSLFKEDLCVNDLKDLLNMSQSAVSHQLRILKQARLVKNRREGKLMIYSLDDDHVKSIFAQVLAHVTE